MRKKKKNRVKPQLLKGFRDYSPAEQIAREEIIGKVRQVVEKMGFLPLQTASLELAETLLGTHYNEDSLAELFGFEGPDEVNMALRYEFTLSLARYVASDPNLPLPFRRYQYGNVWRVDKPGPGRFREFMQFDIDIVGTENLLADAEIISAMVTTFEMLGIKNFKVKFSNRKILNGLIEYVGISEETGPDVMRVIDKLDKQGKEAVLLELGSGRIDKSGDKINGLQLPEKQILILEEFIDMTKSENAFENSSKLLNKIEISQQGFDELKLVSEYLNMMDTDSMKYEIDLSIVRGLGYYTGPVFETTLLDLPDFGSVFSGGRYDNLVDRFSGKSMPAVGSSIGVDRLLAALIELNAIELKQATSDVLVTVMDKERIGDYISLVKLLRENNIPAEIYSGDTKNLTKQIKYADKVGIPFALIAGSNEFDSGTITIKNLKAGREKAVSTSDREEWLKAEDIQETIESSDLIKFLKENISN
jgi:histidyl-tRNA synthetase